MANGISYSLVHDYAGDFIAWRRLPKMTTQNLLHKGTGPTAARLPWRRRKERIWADRLILCVSKRLETEEVPWSIGVGLPVGVKLQQA